MKDYLIELVHATPDLLSGRNLAREYLQARILGTIQRNGAMIPLAIHGGTALRFLYGHGRFSEDLDFTLEQSPEQYNFRQYLHEINRELVPEGYVVELKVKDQKAVHSAFVRFPGLPYELGLSGQRTESFSIKLEVDTRPPVGANTETTVVRHFIVLQLHHHDRASLLSGKLHAILQRIYTKGRDLFDLFWYLSDPNWPSPNLVMLNHALEQTGWGGPSIDDRNWRYIVHERIQKIDWEVAVNDVKPFLEPDFDIHLLTKQNLESLLIKSSR